VTERGDTFAEVQRAYFEEAEVERFRWTTSAPGFAETEDALLAPLTSQLASPCLEIGCGEGNNLVRLARQHRCVGVDLYPRKLRFAARELPECRFASADATKLPFADACFRAVFVRDLLHHVREPRDVIAEVARVLAPGGRFCLLEPNGRNPLVWLQTRTVPAEAGAREFTPARVARMLEGAPFEDVRMSERQPFPLRRALLHYEKGLPRLGASRAARGALAFAEGALGALLPRSRWTYVQIAATRAPALRRAGAGSSP
jgi:SAM-dependent methyltransferase